MRDEKRKLGAQRHGSKNFEKKRKKFLTSWKKCGKLKKFTASFEKTSLNASVPCKLNNVKTKLTPWTIMDCLSVSEKQPTKILE